jgi:hypothetical protein
MKAIYFIASLVLFAFASCANKKTAVISSEETTEVPEAKVDTVCRGLVIRQLPIAGELSVMEGKVFDIQTGELLPWVFVKLISTTNGNEYNGNTDMEGCFTVNGIKKDTYTVQFSFVGYQTISTALTIDKATRFDCATHLTVLDYGIQVDKPVIYLYPTQETNVAVKLHFDGRLSHTYPLISENGWKVRALPNGTLCDERGQEYYALFWEGIPRKSLSPSTGFVVKGEETMFFLEKKLEELGLNRREANEFIMYWLPRMENNAYNLIHFAGMDYEEMAELVVEPKPETIIRVMMLTQALSKPVNIAPQNLTTLKHERKGFTLIEWGGSEVVFDLPSH